MPVWLPYIREDAQPWRVLCRPSLKGGYTTSDAACDAARDLYPDLPHPSPGAIGTAPFTHVRLMLAPTAQPPTPPPATVHSCPTTCPRHPDQPLTHLTGHTTAGVRAASLLARSGYTDLADITAAHHCGLLNDLTGLGPSGRALTAALATGRPAPQDQPDLHRLSVLLAQAQTLTAHHPALDQVHDHLTHTRHALKRLTHPKE